jgi:hypothetical protein
MKYNIGVNRNVTVELKDGELFVTIAEENSSKSVTFPAYQWAVCCIPDRNRRECQTASGQARECETIRTRRRCLVCIGDYGFCMRRHSTILQPSEIWRKTDEDRHCTSNQGVVCSAGSAQSHS